LNYTGVNNNSGELFQAVPAPDSHVAEDAPTSLVRRIRSGSREAETQLVQAYQRPILELLRNRARDPDLAQDLLQETFIVVINRLRADGIEQPDKLAAFIHRVAHNLVIGHFRKETRRKTQTDTELVEIQQDQKSEQLEAFLRKEEGQIVRRLLEELKTPRDREILRRFYVWGQEKPLICDALGLDNDQFDRVISRARQRFRVLAEQAFGGLQ
jgi:RNA polymerase sigma-70 factor (ECF subfamily)